MLLCTTPSLTPVCIAGRRDVCVAIEDRHLEVVLVVEGRRKEGKTTRAVRRKVVVGIMLGGGIEVWEEGCACGS
jgi:hypothetical protein